MWIRFETTISRIVCTLGVQTFRPPLPNTEYAIRGAGKGLFSMCTHIRLRKQYLVGSPTHSDVALFLSRRYAVSLPALRPEPIHPAGIAVQD